MQITQNAEWTFDYKTNLHAKIAILKTSNAMRNIAKPTTVEKKAAYITLPFKGDSVGKLITRWLTKGIEETYKAPKSI